MFNLFNIVNDISNGLSLTVLDILSVLSLLFGISVINSKNPILSVLFLIGLFISISINLILLGYNFLGLSYLLVYVGAVSILFLFILMLINVRISELLNETNNSIPLAIYTGFTFSAALYLNLNNLDKASYSDRGVYNQNFLHLFTHSPKSTKKIIGREVSGLDLINQSEGNLSKTQNSNLLYNKVSFHGENVLSELSASKGNLVRVNLLDKSSEIYLVSSSSWDNNLIDMSDITSIGNVLYSTYAIWLIISSLILLLAMIGAITITKKEKD